MYTRIYVYTSYLFYFLMIDTFLHDNMAPAPVFLLCIHVTPFYYFTLFYLLQ